MTRTRQGRSPKRARPYFGSSLFRNTRVALISGRALESLESVTELPDEALLVGSHGIEIRLDSPEHQLRLTDSERERKDALHEALDGVVDAIDQVWLEPKPAGFALHTRLATEADSRIAHLEALSEAGAVVDDLKIREGKNVLEFSVRSTHKGEALEHLRTYTSADAVLFAGDDVTDEDAFAALQPHDLGLKSGKGETLAAHRVSGPLAVAQVLDLLAEYREGGRHEQ